jgi:hypothetical protein
MAKKWPKNGQTFLFLANSFQKGQMATLSFGDTDTDIWLGGAAGQILLKSPIYIKLFVIILFQLHSIFVLSSYGSGVLLIGPCISL